ncbi:MAG: hypothetical protein NVSMB24_02270 [Mucilaginibacter sp.]
MQNMNDGHGQEPGQNRSNTTGEKASKSAGKDKSRYYKEGEESATGPNWDKKSKGSEGDTGQNAGVFK